MMSEQERVRRTGIFGSIPNVFLAGYRRQLSLALTLCKEAERQDTSFRVLLTGYPGNGKWTFAQRLVENVMQTLPKFVCCSVCAPLIGAQPADIDKLRRDLERHNGPRLLIVKGVDDGFPPVEAGTPEASLYLWLAELLEGNPSTGVIVLISDYPTKLPRSFLDAISVPIYLPMPGEDQAAEMFGWSGIPEPVSQQVASAFFARARNDQLHYTGRALSTASRNVIERHTSIAGCTQSELAELIRLQSQSVDRRQLKEYEDGVALLRTRSDLVLNRWEPTAAGMR